jgi:hypothetical protein
LLPNLEAIFYIDQPPTFEFRNGLFHICQTVGNYRFERVMPPHVFMATVKAAVEAARLYRRADNVVPLHAASASGKPSK